MPGEFGALLFELAKKIVFAAVSKRVVYAGEAFFVKRRIESRLGDSIAQVVEGLLPFFESEHVSEDQRLILLGTCEHEFTALLDEPQEIFAASLDGQKVFDRRYASGRLPQAIRDEGLDDLYARVFPQIANLVCAYPPAIEQWKVEGYREGFKRLDEIAATLGNLAGTLDKLASRETKTADVLRARVAQSLIQSVGFQLELVGLRGERPDAVPLEKCFIVPEFSRRVMGAVPDETREIRVGTETDISSAFADGCVRALVIGAPGSGKSTWSLWLQKLVLTGPSQRLAVVVRLRDLVKGETLPGYQEIVRGSAGTHLRDEVHAGTVRGWCEAGVITFVLDGFDEVPPTKRGSVLAWVRGLDSAIGNAGLILTSRPLTSEHLNGLPERWMRWEMLPFDEPRIADYISRWYAHAPVLAAKSRDVDAAALAREWVDDSAIHPLVGTPLMLATVLMVHHMDGELPGGRARLYERYIKGMLGLWDSRWGVPAAIDLLSETKERILTRLALDMHLAEIEQLGDSEIEELLAVILKQVGCTHSTQDVLNHLRERSGLLIGPGTWSFVHKNVGEFLVAAAIRDGDQVDDAGEKLDRMRLFRERHNDRWNAVLFFWAGLAAPGDLQSFIELVIAEPGDKEFLLALGLIHDQLEPHRLTEPWKSERLLQLLRRGLLEPEEDFKRALALSTALPQGVVPEDVPVPSRNPRGFENVHFDDTILNSLWASTITPEQAFNCHASLRPLVWLMLAIYPRSVTDLRSALTGAPTPKLLLFPLASGPIHAANGRCGVTLAQFLDTVLGSLPEHGAKVVFLLLGTVAIESAFRPRFGLLPRQETIQGGLRAIRATRDKEEDAEWLRLSRKFVYSHSGMGADFDLLDTFLEAIDEFVREGRLVEDDLVADVRSYVIELRKRRDASLGEP